MFATFTNTEGNNGFSFNFNYTEIENQLIYVSFVSSAAWK